jgi:hypothetical protein
MHSCVYVVSGGGGGIAVLIVHVSDGVDGSKPFARSRRGLPAADD